MESYIMKSREFKKINFKQIAKLNFFVIVILILTWSTPSFCPLTFGQASSLKELPKDKVNLGKVLTAVQAEPKDQTIGLKILAKTYGVAATKAALEDKLQELIAATAGGGGEVPPATPPAAAAPRGPEELRADIVRLEGELAAAAGKDVELAKVRSELAAAAGKDAELTAVKGELAGKDAELAQVRGELVAAQAAVAAAAGKDAELTAVRQERDALTTAIAAVQQELADKVVEGEASEATVSEYYAILRGSGVFDEHGDIKLEYTKAPYV